MYKDVKVLISLIEFFDLETLFNLVKDTCLVSFSVLGKKLINKYVYNTNNNIYVHSLSIKFSISFFWYKRWNEIGCSVLNSNLKFIFNPNSEELWRLYLNYKQLRNCGLLFNIKLSKF